MPPARHLIALAMLALAAGPTFAAPAHRATPTAAKAATTNWLAVVVATPQGGFRQGNPDAKVKLLEFGSLTCPHCGAFDREGVAELRAHYIPSGRVSYEYRPFLLNGVDFAPALLVLCQTPAAALKMIDAFYDEQPIWIAPFTKPLSDEAQKKLAALPENQQIGAFAIANGLDAFMRTRGVTRATFDKCTSDAGNIARLNAIRDDANRNYGLTSVPTFAINGRKVPETSTWAQLKPVLDAAP